MAAVPEVISPELVLVDPELAARVRASWSWGDVAPVPAPAAGAPAAATAPAAAQRRSWSALRHLRNVALVLSIAFNVLAVTTLLDDSTSVPTSLPPTPTKTVQSAPRVPSPAELAPAQTPPTTQRQALATTAERQLLAELGQVPALRRLFIDPATGIPLSRVSAQCHLVAGIPPSTLLRCRVWRPAFSGAAGARVQLEVAVRCSSAAREEPVRCVA